MMLTIENYPPKRLTESHLQFWENVLFEGKGVSLVPTKIVYLDGMSTSDVQLAQNAAISLNYLKQKYAR